MSLTFRRRRDCPGAEEDGNLEQDRKQPMQQLVVGQLQFVRRLDAVRQRDAPRFEQQRRVGYAEAHMSRPFRGDTARSIEDGENCSHLAVHDGTSEQGNAEEHRRCCFDYFDAPAIVRRHD